MPDNDDPRVTGLRFAKVLVWLIYAYFLVAVIILVLAFFLQLFNASTTADFTEWVYRSADRVLQPFRGIFPTRAIGEQGSVIDFAVLFAIVMYGILALVVHAFVDWLDAKIVALRASETDRPGPRSSVGVSAYQHGGSPSDAPVDPPMPGAPGTAGPQPPPTS